MKLRFILLFVLYTTLAFSQSKVVDTTSGYDKVRFDGFYSSQEKEQHLTSKNMLVLTDDGRVGIKQGGTIGQEPFSCMFYESFRKEYIGTYKMIGDSIFVFIKFLFKKGAILHSKFERLDAVLVGVIKDREMITGWKVVPPYPVQLNKSDFEFVFNQNWMLPQTMVFIKSAAVKCLPSR